MEEWTKTTFPNANATTIAQIDKYYPSPLFSWGRYFTEFGRVKNIIAGNKFFLCC